MDRNRREVMKAGGGAALFAVLAAAGLIRPGEALANGWNKAAFEGKTMPEALKALGAANPANSTDITMKAPDIAENGAVVPVGVESKIAGTESIAIFVDKNPSPLAASFDIPSGTEPSVTTRVKMGQTSDVYAVVKANGKFFIAKKEIKVTLGGCGG
ncbi:MAG: thiosulfate oxidation carrier protein SoxY [Betaproteobacteria bacterium]|jgi:sulfur-oxidizing protein SoxY|nr:thiosulfate oxidation carrier protein SoxY [Betaproteobacteria bacterium]